MSKREAESRVNENEAGANSDIEAMYAEIYWRKLEIMRLIDESEKLTKKANRVAKRNQLDIAGVDDWIAKREARVKDSLPVTDMIRILLWERFYEGMTKQEIVRDIRLRWGRHHKIKEDTIDKALTRLQKSDKGFYKEGDVTRADGHYEHEVKPHSYWPDKNNYKTEIYELKGKEKP